MGVEVAEFVKVGLDLVGGEGFMSIGCTTGITAKFVKGGMEVTVEKVGNIVIPVGVVRDVVVKDRRVPGCVGCPDNMR